MQTPTTFTLSQLAFGALTLLGCAMPVETLLAQDERRAERFVGGAPRIEAFNVDEVPRLAPGVELNFDLYGSPGGAASLRIAGATHNLMLIETESGQYEGTYIISSRDNIAARSNVTANLRVGNQITSAVLVESLQTGVGRHEGNSAPGPQPEIRRFELEPAYDLSSGNALHFTLHGSPGGKAELNIRGVKGKVFMSEVRPGEYENHYTIRNRDQINSDSPIVATLYLDGRSKSVTLGRSLLSQSPAGVKNVAYQRVAVVESVNVVETKGEGNYLGTIGGGVLGLIIGSQIGGGSGRTAAQIAGTLGGAYAGHEIEGNNNARRHYEVVVRLPNGARQTYSYAQNPGFHPGEQVRIVKGALVAR